MDKLEKAPKTLQFVTNSNSFVSWLNEHGASVKKWKPERRRRLLKKFASGATVLIRDCGAGQTIYYR